MLGRPVRDLRKYCVPDTAETEPNVTVFQLPSEKFSVFQFGSTLLADVYIFHSALFVTG